MKWLMILLCLIWGYNWVMMKVALDYFPPVTFASFRFLTGAVVLLFICYYKRISLPSKGDWKWYALCGFLQTAYIFSATQIALQYLDAGITSLLGFTMPFWLTILAHFFIEGERMTVQKIFGVLIGLVGLIFVLDIQMQTWDFGLTTLAAQLLVLSGSMAWAISTIITKKVLKNRNQIQFTTYQMLIGAIALFLFAFVFESWDAVSFTTTSIITVAFSGIIASALAFLLWFYILQHDKASNSSISLLLVPVVGVISGWLFLDETLSWMKLIGVVCVLLGIAIVNMNFIQRLFLRKKIVVEMKNEMKRVE